MGEGSLLGERLSRDEAFFQPSSKLLVKQAGDDDRLKSGGTEPRPDAPRLLPGYGLCSRDSVIVLSGLVTAGESAPIMSGMSPAYTGRSLTRACTGARELSFSSSLPIPGQGLAPSPL